MLNTKDLANLLFSTIIARFMRPIFYFCGINANTLYLIIFTHLFDVTAEKHQLIIEYECDQM